VRNVVNPAAEHCAECLALAALGYIPADEMVPVGERLCGPGCKCRIESRGGTLKSAAEQTQAVASSGPVVEQRRQPRITEFNVGDRVRGRVTVGTVIGREADGRYIVRADNGKVTRIRAAALKPAGPPAPGPGTPPTPPTPGPADETASGAPKPPPTSVPFRAQGEIRAPIGAYVIHRGGKVRGTFMGMREGKAFIRTDRDTEVTFDPDELTIGTDPRLEGLDIPAATAPAPGSLSEASQRISRATGGITVYEGPVDTASAPRDKYGTGFAVAASTWGKPFVYQHEKLALAQQVTKSVERLKRMFPGLKIRGPTMYADTTIGRAVTPALVQDRLVPLKEVRTAWVSSVELSPLDKLSMESSNRARGTNWTTGGPDDFHTGATRHEIAHTQSTQAARTAWDRVRARIGFPSRFSFQQRVSEYGGSDDWWEEVAESASMVTHPDYKPGTLPFEIEEFVVRLYNGEFWVDHLGRPVP
jgi:hypothetical protein